MERKIESSLEKTIVIFEKTTEFIFSSYRLGLRKLENMEL